MAIRQNNPETMREEGVNVLLAQLLRALRTKVMSRPSATSQPTLKSQARAAA